MRTIFQEFCYQIRYNLPIWAVFCITSPLPECGPATRFRGMLASFFLPGNPRGLRLGRDITLLSIHRLRLGSNVYLAKGCWLNAIGGLELSDEVTLGPYVVISTTKHTFKNGSVFQGGAQPAPVAIGFGTWLASHASITAGVTVGSGCLVAANCVVTKNVISNVVVAGVPGKVIGARLDEESTVFSKHDVV